MRTYALRDARIADLDAAVAALAPEREDLRTALESERAALARTTWAVADATVRAVGLDWLWLLTTPLPDALKADPVNIALGRVPLAAEDLLLAVDDIPHGGGTRLPGYHRQVLTALGGNQAALDQLAVLGHRAWLARPEAERPYPFDDVAVLLPLRLDTLFDPPASEHNNDPELWRLSLRVVPQEPSILRLDRHIDDQEITALDTFWAAVFRPGPVDGSWLDGDAGHQAFARLALAVGPARAAWLVGTTSPRQDAGAVGTSVPQDLPPENEPNRIGGMPPRLSVAIWTFDADLRAQLVPLGTLPLDPDSTIDPQNLELPLFTDAASAGQGWLVSWEAAVKAGVAGSWLLPPGLGPEQLGGIAVTGVGDDPAEEHFSSHADFGTLRNVALGTSTNSVNGSPTALNASPQNASELEQWRVSAAARLEARASGAQEPSNDAGGRLARYLAGSEQALPDFPGTHDDPQVEVSRLMVRALWPALWGQWLLEFWNTAGYGEALTDWALHTLYPEGPLPPIRFGTEPYGVLPVTLLDSWQPDDRGPGGPAQDERNTALAHLATALGSIRRTLHRQLAPNGTLRGRDARGFAELLGQGGISAARQMRLFADGNLPLAALGKSPAERADALRTMAEHFQRGFERLKLPPVTPSTIPLPVSLSLKGTLPTRSRLPLVQPTRMLYLEGHGDPAALVYPLPDLVQHLLEPGRFAPDLSDYDLERVFSGYIVTEDAEYRLRVLPDSLLIRLLLHATQTAYRWSVEQPGSLEGVLKAQQGAALDLAARVDPSSFGPWEGRDLDPATGRPRVTLDMPDGLRSELERALAATLDSASTRIDPWATGFAWERLDQTTRGARNNHRLGVYGWANGPFAGTPGPTASGRLHTPSFDQTLATTVLRDKYGEGLRTGSLNEAGQNPWAMNLTGSTVRAATDIAEDVRAGMHIFEVVGHRIEHILSVDPPAAETRSAYRRLADLRAAYPMYADRIHPRQVCNGQDALAGLLAGNPLFPLSVSQQEAVSALARSLDTYADLLVADGITHSLGRQGARAADAMDAASGLGPPPAFEFSRTRPSGYQLETTVLSVIPWADAPAGATPARLADASVAAFLDGRLGGGWAWTVSNADDGAPLGTVALDELGLAPVDTLAHSGEHFEELARHRLGLPMPGILQEGNRVWSVALAGADHRTVSLRQTGVYPGQLGDLDPEALAALVRSAAGAPEDAAIDVVSPPDGRLWTVHDELGRPLGMADSDLLGLDGPALDALAEADLHRRIRAALGIPLPIVRAPRQLQLCAELSSALGIRPAAGRDVGPDAGSGAYADLVRRYTAVHSAATAAVQVAANASALGEIGRAEQLAALALVAHWGVTPVAAPAGAATFYAACLGQEPPPEGTAPHLLANAAAQALAARLAGFPDPAGLVPAEQMDRPVPDHLDLKTAGTPDGMASLARSLSTLACSSGKLAVLARSQPAELLTATDLSAGGPPAPETSLDEDWLAVVAAARAPLARFEAVQLDPALAPLAAWSSSPGDPWRTAAVADNLARRATGRTAALRMPRLVVAYGPDAVWEADEVAAGLVDSFSESVPMPQRNTYAAFGFNAPATRAQQAILLAVPPVAGTRIDEDLLHGILQEVRELAVARTVESHQLGQAEAVAPASWLRNYGPTRVRLEPFPLYE